jgi:hypothetical protein
VVLGSTSEEAPHNPIHQNTARFCTNKIYRRTKKSYYASGILKFYSYDFAIPLSLSVLRRSFFYDSICWCSWALRTKLLNITSYTANEQLGNETMSQRLRANYYCDKISGEKKKDFQSRQQQRNIVVGYPTFCYPSAEIAHLMRTVLVNDLRLTRLTFSTGICMTIRE